MAPDGCWIWTGKVDRHDGYGRITVRCDDGKKRHRLVHRVLWEMLFGPVPFSLDIDHTCHNESTRCEGGAGCPHRRCANPSHLRTATRGENLRAGVGPAASKARQTECVRGHPLDAANTYVRPNGTRRCRRCMYDASAASRKRTRQRAEPR